MSRLAEFHVQESGEQAKRAVGATGYENEAIVHGFLSISHAILAQVEMTRLVLEHLRDSMPPR